jgi:hypothetical protein
MDMTRTEEKKGTSGVKKENNGPAKTQKGEEARVSREAKRFLVNSRPRARKAMEDSTITLIDVYESK